VLGAPLLELGDVLGRGGGRLALRNEEIAAITRLHVDLVAEVAEVLHFLQQDEFHDLDLFVSVGGTGAACAVRRWMERAGATRSRRRRRQRTVARHARDPASMRVAVRQQREEARVLDRGAEHALVARLGTGDAARHDLAGLADVLAQHVEILVVDLGHALGGETAELLAAEELGHGNTPWIRAGAYSAAGSAAASSRGARGSRGSRRGRSSSSPPKPKP